MVGHTLADCTIFLKLRKPERVREGGTSPAHAASGGGGGGGVWGAPKAPRPIETNAFQF